MHIIEETRTKLLFDLKEWIKENQLKVNTLSEDVYEVIGYGKFLLVNPKSLTPYEADKNEIVLQGFKLFLDEFESSLTSNEFDYYLFQFGTQFYYTKDPEDPKFTIFKYLGKANLELQEDYPYLGVHGGYELSHGSRSYKDWCKKAKFLGITTLGICEENTLSGTLAFQNYCEKEGIKPIIGETVTIKDGPEYYKLKLYPKNQVGFENLLRVSNIINNNVEKFCNFDDFVKEVGELICVISGEVTLTDIRIKRYKELFNEDVYYQLDYTEWSSDERDIKYLENLQLYFNKYIDSIKPVLLVDSYYLDEKDAIVRKYLNKMGNVGFKPQSDKQYFKSVDEIFTESCLLFYDDDERQITLIEEGIKNAKEIASKISFKYQATYLHLPEYEMSQDEIDKYGTSEGLFFHLIEKGFNRKIKGKVEDEGIYWDRLELEIDVLQRGNFVDYFLILWDVYNFCEENNIWVGLGRGSSAGSAVAWVLGITGVDPIRYNLLFERFLNEGRLFKDINVEKIIVNSGENEVELDMLEVVIVKRGGKEIEISASEIKEGDDLINSKMRDLWSK